MAIITVTTGAALGLFARSIIKSGGDFLFGEDKSLFGLFKKELATSYAEQAPNFINKTLGKLNLKRSTRDKLLHSNSIFDLAGIAWADLLSQQPDDLVSQCTEFPTSSKLARELDPCWFIEAVTSARASEIAFTIGAKDLDNQDPFDFEKPLIDSLISLISTEITDELQLTDTQPRPLVERIITRLPERIYQLWLSIPGIELRVTRLNTKEILRRVDGSADKDDLTRGLRALSQQLIENLDEDVFGRQLAQEGEPPIITHNETYVEPEATLQRVKPDKSSAITAEKAPIKQLIRKIWASNLRTQLVVLHAPFGYGKSVTFKSLAADLARDWQKKPEQAPFPVLLRCPEILSGHISTLKAAVQNSLEKQTQLTTSVVERIWASHKLVLLLDSFDEVHMSEKEAQGWFEEMRQVSNDDRIRVLVASRPHAFSSKWLRSVDWEIEIQPFDAIRGQQWLDSVAGRIGPKNLTFHEVSSTLDATLAGTPILLFMAAYGWNDNATSKPTSKAALYRRFIEKISTGKWADVQEAHQVVQQGMDSLAEFAGNNAFQKALRLLSWEYLKTEQRHTGDDEAIGLTRRHVSDTLQANFSGIGDEQVDTITRSLCLSLFLHKAAGTESITFTHRSFREYLCAERLIEAFMLEQAEGSRYPSAWRLMTEAKLGEAELNFAAELFQEADSNDRSRVIKRLDAWYKETRSIFLKSKTELQIEKAEPDVEVGLTPPEADRSSTFRTNVEGLSLAARNLSLIKIEQLLRKSLVTFDRHRRELLSDGVYRIATTLMTRDHDRRWALGYHVETGGIAFISPIDELESYREHFKQLPGFFLPITHVSKTYFACSTAGMIISRGVPTIHSKSALAEFTELARKLNKASLAGVKFSSRLLIQWALTPDGIRFGFCPRSDDEGFVDMQHWWSRRALLLAADAHPMTHLSPLFDPHDSEQTDAINKHMRLVNTIFKWPIATWDELIIAFEEAFDTTQDSSTKELIAPKKDSA